MHSLIAGIANSFTDNLIAEQRYRMILDGLQVTLLITFCAAVLGTLLGGVVCWARMSRKPWLRQTAKIYIDLMRGTPVLVFLMLMYYVFMAPLGTTGITVAVVTFAMNASAYIGEMLRSSIESIDRGQREAGLALGHTPRQTFFRIILPQVVKAVQPVYQGEVISLLKGTSIVGYIAVMDMTPTADGTLQCTAFYDAKALSDDPSIAEPFQDVIQGAQELYHTLAENCLAQAQAYARKQGENVEVGFLQPQHG